MAISKKKIVQACFGDCQDSSFRMNCLLILLINEVLFGIFYPEDIIIKYLSRGRNNPVVVLKMKKFRILAPICGDRREQGTCPLYFCIHLLKGHQSNFIFLRPPHFTSGYATVGAFTMQAMQGAEGLHQ